MDRDALAPRIDHTILGPETTWPAVETVLEEATAYGMNACIPPCYLEEATAAAPDCPLVTVIGFPHGQHARNAKRREGVLAWKAGADELDVVCNIGRLKAGEQDAVTAELEELIAAVPIPVKVILETGLLTDEELHAGCEAAVDAGAPMVKTSTGFGPGGATTAAVSLMSEYLPVKASGGIGTYEQAVKLLEAGADRIGASSGVAILEGAPE